MRLQTGVMPARQWIKIHGKNPSNVIVREERNSPVPPPVSSELTREKHHLQQQEPEAGEKQARFWKAPHLLFPPQKGVTAGGLGQILPGGPGTAPTPHWLKHSRQ